MFPKRSTTSALVLGILAAGAPLRIPARAEEYRAGVARCDITPEEPIWMSGYGNRNRPSEGVEQPLHAKALALEAGEGGPAVLVTADLIGFPAEFADALAGRVHAELGIPRERFLMIASHTHTGPVVHNSLGGMFDLAEADAAVVQRHSQKMAERIFATVSQAVQRLEPARLALGYGRAGFAANRRVFRAGGVNFGVNPDGPVDHEVPVLRVAAPSGELRAVVFGYACHCTTLGGDYYRICGDWASYAQEYLELAHPGATALFITGCGADANPEPRGKLEFARRHGLQMAGSVASVLDRPMTEITGALQPAFERVELPLSEAPSHDEFQKRLQDKNVFVQRHARRHLDRLERGEELAHSYPCPVQVWRFGDDLTLVALGGEVVVDYALRLKRELPGGHVWLAAYANDVFAYIPSVRILLEGGYEADFSMIYYGLPTRFAPGVEDALVRGVQELVRRTNP